MFWKDIHTIVVVPGKIKWEETRSRVFKVSVHGT